MSPATTGTFSAIQIASVCHEANRQLTRLVGDPRTPLTDEARRPLLAGGDYLAREKQRSCDEALAFGQQLAVKFGRPGAR